MDIKNDTEETRMLKQDVLKCSYSSWSRKFGDNLFRSIVLRPLPESFIDYLAEESIRLPDASATDIVQNSDNEYSDWSDAEAENGEMQNFSERFKDLHSDIESAIKELGGAVIPKLNWSAPKDARWMMPNNKLRCISPSDIYLLLKSSDHIADDLDHAFDVADEVEESREGQRDIEYELVLKQWVDINPALEFRVFVKERKIIAVSQRDINHYEYLAELVPKFRSQLDRFFEEVAQRNLPEKDVIMDVYIPKPFKKVWIVDINPFSKKSDSLLFTWNELDELNPSYQNDYDFRVLNETNLGRFSAKEYSESQVPVELVDASLNPDTLAELAREWKHLKLHQDQSV